MASRTQTSTCTQSKNTQTMAMTSTQVYSFALMEADFASSGSSSPYTTMCSKEGQLSAIDRSCVSQWRSEKRGFNEGEYKGKAITTTTRTQNENGNLGEAVLGNDHQTSLGVLDNVLDGIRACHHHQPIPHSATEIEGSVWVSPMRVESKTLTQSVV